ncbi:MAG: xanthine dehydrogenase family protein molybdopterin-binding subunit [Rhodobacteraceae bacterium]|jgi:isoquinoline 1-oxidoreductase beta subunit|uniref:Isoquinoline 1-oxidoreductase, beta subunit n=1 Tax=Salipiger profundus TaxID=1229727 RepID=A0A1U7D988_9RHOB|nr:MULTISPECIES: molybdopterin cofactor-binding domain-containing protein [Salipiger]APX24699.1 isoquinoline 1-oxidoreductase, beta subunit [Salipiger profundus]MAB09234.1 xanthine dehydrogenase family protein molybdopterin-binding subunit [Paracoccaceae bacterium]GFZ97158.1 dehydrogenase [Salipiger profundus]
MTVTLSRRRFLASATAGAFVIGAAPNGALAFGAPPKVAGFTPFIRIDSDNRITVIVKHFEMGQGTSTGLPALVAEELNADLGAIIVEFAPVDPAYNNLLMGAQLTGGSTAMANSYMQYRKAAAAARDVLLEAAAQEWGVAAQGLALDDGTIRGAGRSGEIGEFVEAAARLDLPQEPVLKDPSQFRLIGNASARRKDTPSKVNGSAKFGMDVQLADQIIAVMIRPPRLGARLTSFDASGAEAVRGFIGARPRDGGNGVVVLAEDTWAAFQARAAITTEWDFSGTDGRSQDAIRADMLNKVRTTPEFEARADKPRHEVAATIDGAANMVEGEYFFPSLAHAPMEPINCTVEPDGKGGVVLHDGCQFPTQAQALVAATLGLDPAKVAIKTYYAGGSFGRRANTDADYQVEAAEAFQLSGGDRPVKLVHSREDDITGGYYRPAFAHRVQVGLDAEGRIVGWDHQLAGQSIIKGTPFEEALAQGGVDALSVEGVRDTGYAVGDMFVGLTDEEPLSKVLWWRSVGHSHTAYAMETMMDKAARAVGADPVAFRLRHLAGDGADQKRLSGVLKAAAEASGWDTPAPEGRARGVAVHKSFNSYVAEVVEVSQANGAIRIEKVTCAVDCGVAVNPDIIRAQMESGIGYGLGHVMRDAITFADGAVEQRNFPDYEPLRVSDIGEIDVVIVPSEEAPTGVGEPAVPPSGPALANAIAALMPDASLSALPLEAHGIRFA